MNWGYKILFVIIAFIAIMVAMVTVAFRQTNEMMDENYYEAEVNYQQRINASNSLNDVSMDSLIVNNGPSLSLIIPSSLIAGFQNGEIEFLKNNDQSKDKKISFKPDNKGQFSIDKSTLSLGSYKARILWTTNTKKYYREQNILLK